MKDKLKALFDARTTWATIGVVAGTIWGHAAVQIVDAVGYVIMAIL